MIALAYLSQVDPVNRIGKILPSADRTQREGLFRAEKDILRQERSPSPPPGETLRIMEQVKKAAFASGAPSGQDMRGDAAASAASAKARAEMGRRRAEKTYEKNIAHDGRGQFTLSA